MESVQCGRRVAAVCFVFLATACGGAAPPPAVASGAPPAENEPAGSSPQPGSPGREAIEAWIASVEIRVDRPTAELAIPDDFTRRGAAPTTWTSPDRRSVIVRHPHGVVVRASLAGPDTPPGVRARLLPVLHGGTWPHFALLVDGWDVAAPLRPHGRGALPFRVPLRRATTDGPALDDGTALEQTARLVHVSDCESEHGDDVGCMYYGAEAELRTVEGADVPGGWLLTAESPNAPDAGAVWTDPEPYEREPGPVGITLRTTDTGEEDEDSELDITTRVFLRRGDRLTHAFDLATRATLDEYADHVGRVIPVDDALLVWVSVQGFQHAFSWHDPATGDRIGEPVLVGLSPHLGEPHGQPPDLHPVVDGSELRFALNLYGRSDALLFDHPEAVGRFVPVVLGSGDQLDDDGRLDDSIVSPYLRLDRCGVSPCLRDPGSRAQAGGAAD